MAVTDNPQGRMPNALSHRPISVPKPRTTAKIVSYGLFSLAVVFGGSKLHGQNLNKELAALTDKSGERTLVVEAKKELGFPPYFNKDGSIPKEYANPKEKKWGVQSADGIALKIKTFENFVDNKNQKTTLETLPRAAISIVDVFHTNEPLIDGKAIDVIQINETNGKSNLRVTIFDANSGEGKTKTFEDVGKAIGSAYWMGKAYVLTDQMQLVVINIQSMSSKSYDLSEQFKQNGVDPITGTSVKVVQNKNGYVLSLGGSNSSKTLEIPVDAPVGVPVSSL